MVSIVIGLSLHHIKTFQDFFILNKVIDGRKILITSTKLNFDINLWDEVILVEFSFNNNSKSKIDRLKNINLKVKGYKRVIKKLEPYKQKEVKLFYSSLEDVLSNYLFFYFSKNLKGYVIEDGVLNYYDHNIKYISITTLILKKIVAKLYGMNFKFFKGHTSGIDYEKAILQYVRAPELSVNPNKSIRLSYQEAKIDVLTDTILIIGQEPYANVNIRLYYRKLEKLIRIIKELDSYQNSVAIYYKSHRNGPRIPSRYLEERFLGKKIIFLNTSDSIEFLYFNKLKSKFIFTFDSSAVLNIYLAMNSTKRKEVSINVMPFYSGLVKLFSILHFNIIRDDF